jgi:hypothetical protein
MTIERDDFDGDELAVIPTNDNNQPDPRARRVPRYVGRGATGVLLALAGYDPETIPRKLHVPALRVVWCFAHGLHNRRLVARAANLSSKTVARTLAAMRVARLGCAVR